MTAEAALALLDVLRQAGVEAVVDGGWGVDALLGFASREHDDLDLVVGLDDVPRIRAALRGIGFADAEDELPVRFAMKHPERGSIDFHTVAWDAQGGGVQPQLGGGSFRYPPEGFTTGQIGGRHVRCISVEIQLLCHLGYEPDEKDVHDVRMLHEQLGAELPEVWARRLGG